jgi:hypothetical protein
MIKETPENVWFSEDPHSVKAETAALIVRLWDYRGITLANCDGILNSMSVLNEV